MHIRLATTDDAPTIAAVASDAWHAAYDAILGVDAVDGLIEEWYAVGALETSIDRGNAPMFVAEDAGAMLGFAQGGPSPDGPADAVIHRIYVHPTRWGEGIGTALLDRLCSHLVEAGHDDLWLGVFAENEVGRRFYETKGFTEIDRRLVELKGTDVMEVRMSRNLRS